MRNNAAEPTMGHVIMFAAASLGWLVLFLVNLAMYNPGTGWWLRALFSATLMLGSAVFTALLWRRMSRSRAARTRAGRT